MTNCPRTSCTCGGDQKIRRRAMATHSAFLFVIFTALCQTDPVIGCTVTPPAAAVLGGNSISITCRPTSDEYVNQWRRQNENRTVYVASNIRSNRTVADGYSVDDSNPNEITLTLQNASIQYVDSYECVCFNPTTNTPSRGYTSIIVIETEPLFIATNSLSSDEPVMLTCSLKFAGIANLLMQITNSAGKVLARRNETITTTSSQQFDLYNSTSVAIEKIYFCNISLASDASDPKTTIFSRNLTRTVQFSVRDVSISSESPEHCEKDGFCKKNSVIRCKAEGNPEPRYNFTIYQNGTIVRFLPNKQEYTTEYVGQQIIQCTAFNTINGSQYPDSINFTTNGTEESLAAYSAGGPNGALIGGLVGGLVGGTLLIIIIAVILIWYKRQRSKQSGEARTRTEDAIETKDFTKGNKGNGQTTNGQTNIAEISGDERVLIDNTLYSGSKGGAVYNAAIDPSAPVFLYGNHRSLQPTRVNMHQLRTSAIPVAQYGYQFSKFQPNSFYARQHY